MKNINYEIIAKEIDPNLIVYREGNFVYLLYPDSAKNGNILFEETNDDLIVWSDEYKEKTVDEVFFIINKIVDTDIIFPFLESKEEYNAVLALGGERIEFEIENKDDFCQKYGSYAIKKRI